MITLSTGHGIGSRPMERGESSSGQSSQFAKKALKSVLDAWVETILPVIFIGFDMIKHVQEILSMSE